MPTFPTVGQLNWGAPLQAYIVAKDAVTFDVKDHGAVGDGVTDDADAINAAITAAAALGARVFARGTFKIGSTVTISGNADLSDATFNYTGTTIALNVGTTTSEATVASISAKLPNVVYVNKPGTGWTAGTIGVRLVNLVSSDVTVGRVTGFEDGLLLYGIGTGTSYNTIVVRHLDNNKRNVRLSADSTGWANQNTILGGRLSHNTAEGTQVSGTRHVLAENTTNVVNGNTFVGVSLESPNVVEYHVECFGWDNGFVGCRWENSTTANTRVYWRAGSRGNFIQYGFGSQNIVAIVEAGSSTANPITHKYQARMFGTGSTQSALLLENNSSSANPVARVMAAGGYTSSADPTTDYTWEWQSNKLIGKRSTDAASAPRVVLDAVNGVVVVTRAATGSRPVASTAGAGAMFLDSTLNKPIWSDGTNWRDATGTIV